MGASNKTTNYDLPMFTGTDRPSWLGDFNNAMNLIDGAIKGNAMDIAMLNQKTDTTDAEVEVIKEDVENNTARIEANNANIATQGAAINSILSTIGTAFSTTSTYAVGDYCVYQNRLYRCITAITSPGVFTPANWVLVNISTELFKPHEIEWTPTIALGSDLSVIGSNVIKTGKRVDITIRFEATADENGFIRLYAPYPSTHTTALCTFLSGVTNHNIPPAYIEVGTLICIAGIQPLGRASMIISGSYYTNE